MRAGAGDDERMSLVLVGVGPRESATIRLTRPSLVVTLEAAAVDASSGRHASLVDRTALLLLPARSRVTLRSRTPSNRVAVLGFGDKLLDAVAKRYAKLGMARDRLVRWLSKIESLPRTVWVHEIVHRYVFERDALGEHDSPASCFLETEIVKEIYFLFRDREDGADRATTGHRYSVAVERAIAWIEAHLFEPCTMSELARRAGASESTVLRSFWREIGSTPMDFWRERRLEAAHAILRSGRYSVAEVAAQVGYVNVTSFGHAFRRRFGVTPSTQLRRKPTRRAP